MDGVLIDANGVIERAWREAAQLCSRVITEEDIRSHIHGRPGPHTIRALFSDLPRSDQEKVQAHVMHVENTATYEPIPGVARTIAQLSEAGITLGIVIYNSRLRCRARTPHRTTTCRSLIDWFFGHPNTPKTVTVAGAHGIRPPRCSS